MSAKFKIKTTIADGRGKQYSLGFPLSLSVILVIFSLNYLILEKYFA
jgi:hypothetical protein